MEPIKKIWTSNSSLEHINLLIVNKLIILYNHESKTNKIISTYWLTKI